MSLSLTDAHCHLSFKDYSPEEIDGLLLRAKNQGVDRLVNVGAGEGFEGNQHALDLAKKYPLMVSTVGIHPHDAQLVTPEIVEACRTMAQDEKVVAIGEIGLDFHYSHSPHDVQRQVLSQFVELAQSVKKPVMIHDRDAGEDTLNILKKHLPDGKKVMIHCFTGTAELAKKYLDFGCFLSFTGIITFKKSSALREVVAFTPLSQMFVETDAPYLTPEPFRGRRNEPAFVRQVAEKVAEIKGVTLEEVAKITTQNARQFFGLP